jgi:hypothetical protein
MIGGTKVIGTLVAILAVVSLLISPAYCQALGKKGGGYRGPPVEDHPKIDEKAYKAALERIPTPKQAYDPWGIARSSESVKTTKKDQE